ncbi:FecCD family ABC transporter permease [Corynebacterium sp. H130]|uniref:FecCD family ABC transporter permease n=1 Tax=Corynebacterium sp. H130 TaxID=3133444 RepID=UPI00403F4F2F
MPPKVLFGCLTLCGALSFVYSLKLGAVPYSWHDVSAVVASHLFGKPASGSPVDAVVWQLRVPRGLLAMLVGAGLALAGIVMQTLVRNPLADPYLLGVSSGASVGATAVITFGVIGGMYALSLGALLGALAATLCVFLVARWQGGLTPLRLILSGVVLSSAFSAVASFLIFRSSDGRAAQSVMFWMLGSVSGATWAKLLIPAVVLVVSVALVLLISRHLDALAVGADTAAALGVDVKNLRRILFFGHAVLVGVLVAVAGGIGFVGLIIPHLARMLVGSTHRAMVPISMALGAVFLLWVDMISRVAAPPQEIPLGVVTGIIGAPLFLFIMGRRSYRFGGNL